MSVENNVHSMKKLFKILCYSLTIVVVFFAVYALITNFINKTGNVEINRLFIIIFILAFFVYLLDSLLILVKYLSDMLQKKEPTVGLKNIYLFWIACNGSTIFLFRNTEKYGTLGLVMLFALYILSLILYKKYCELAKSNT